MEGREGVVSTDYNKTYARRRNVEAWRRLEAISFTVFVDNLPKDMSKGWLWQIFQFEGEVVDIFMSWKKRKSSTSPFAFVRFSKMPKQPLEIYNEYPRLKY